MVPAPCRRPRRRGLGRGQGARGPGRGQRPRRRPDHRRSRRRRPYRRPASRHRLVRPLPDRPARPPALRPGPHRGLAHRHRRHRRRLPPPHRRPPRHHRSPLGTRRRRSHPHPPRRHQQRRLRRLLALPPDPGAPAALPRHTTRPPTRPVTQSSLTPHSKRATPIGDRVVRGRMPLHTQSDYPSQTGWAWLREPRFTGCRAVRDCCVSGRGDAGG